MSDFKPRVISVPQNIKELNRYVAGKTIQEVRDLYKPEYIAKLASNENRLGCSSRVKESVLKSLETIQDYPDPIARTLRQKLAKKNNVDEDQILLAAGSESVLSIICRTFFEQDDNAVTANATFVGFFVQAGVMNIKVKKVPVTDNYKFDVDGILNSVDGNTKAVYIANPNNPTGTYFTKDEYSRLQRNLPDEVLLIVDEAYYEYAKDVSDYPHALDNLKANVIVLRTFSKAYGLAGFRIGYAIAHPELIDLMMKAKLTFEPTASAQAAAIAALEDEDFLEKSVDLVVTGRNKIYEFFDEHSINYVESISNSVMICMENEAEAAQFTDAMLKEGVILRQVGAFGLPECIRITIGDKKDMRHFENSFVKVMQEILPSV